MVPKLEGGLVIGPSHRTPEFPYIVGFRMRYSGLSGRRQRLLITEKALLMSLLFAHASPPRTKERRTVNKVRSGFPSCSVFRGTPPLH